MRGEHRVDCLRRRIGAGEYPDLDEAYATWDRLRAGRPAPRRADMSPADFRKVLPRMMLADVLPAGGGSEFRYRLAGTGICDVHGADPTGLGPRDLAPPAYGALIHDHYAEAVRTREPALHLIRLDSRDRDRCYARLLLPLSEDGEQVTMLISIDSEAQNSDELRRFFEDNPILANSG